MPLLRIPLFLFELHNLALVGSLVINNAKLINVPIAFGVVNGTTVLAGGDKTIVS
jgi:glucan 1,3-beta-glucosidase